MGNHRENNCRSQTLKVETKVCFSSFSVPASRRDAVSIQRSSHYCPPAEKRYVRQIIAETRSLGKLANCCVVGITVAVTRRFDAFGGPVGPSKLGCERIVTVVVV